MGALPDPRSLVDSCVSVVESALPLDRCARVLYQSDQRRDKLALIRTPSGPPVSQTSYFHSHPLTAL